MSGLLPVLRNPSIPDVAKTLLTYVHLSGQSQWSNTDLALDLGWNSQRVGYAVRLLLNADSTLVDRDRVPVMGGWTTVYTFRPLQ
jgi:hypothetical protein